MNLKFRRDRLLREGKNIFDLTYDSKDKPFRGGVYYGQDYGTVSISAEHHTR